MTTEKEISLSCQMTTQDLYLFSLATIRRKFWWFLLLMCFLALFFIYNVSSDKITLNLQAVVAGLFVFVFVPYAFLLAPYISARKRISTDPRLQQPIKYTFTGDAIDIRASSGDAHLNWTAFAEVVETRRQFLLYPQRAVAYVLPKRCFADATDVHAFRQLLRSKAPKARLFHD
jgi:hypothetical protein